MAIPEGWRLEEVAELLESLEVVPAEEFLTAANALATSGTAIDVDLMASRPGSGTLEGYIFPATYSFSRSVTATEVVLTMVEYSGRRRFAGVRCLLRFRPLLLTPAGSEAAAAVGR